MDFEDDDGCSDAISQTTADIVKLLPSIRKFRQVDLCLLYSKLFNYIKATYHTLY